MDIELVSFKFKLYNVSGLIFVDEHREHVGTLGVCLAPFIRLCIEELQAEDSLPELTHNVDPEHCVDFMSLKAE